MASLPVALPAAAAASQLPVWKQLLPFPRAAFWDRVASGAKSASARPAAPTAAATDAAGPTQPKSVP